MRKTKFRFSSPTVLRGDAPFLGGTVQQWDDAFTGNMDKTLAEVKKLALSAPKRDVSLATTFDLASSKPVRDLRRKSELEQADAHQVSPVQFVDDDGQSWSLPMFVTRTTLSTLLVDDQGDDAGAGQAQ